MVKIQEFGTFSVACLEPQIYKDLSSHLELCALEYHDFGAMEHAFIIQKWPSDQIFHMEYVLLDTHFSWPHGARTFDQLLLVAHFFWLSSYRKYCSSDWKQSTLNVCTCDTRGSHMRFPVTFSRHTQGICKKTKGKNKDTQGKLRHTGKMETQGTLSFPCVSQYSLCVFVLSCVLFTNSLCNEIHTGNTHGNTQGIHFKLLVTYVYCKHSCQRFHFPWRADRLGVLIRSCSKPFLHCQIINSPKKTHWT